MLKVLPIMLFPIIPPKVPKDFHKKTPQVHSNIGTGDVLDVEDSSLVSIRSSLHVTSVRGSMSSDDAAIFCFSDTFTWLG